MRVRIFKPSVSVTQSSCGCKGRLWRIEPEQDAPRAQDPLMGWVSAKDSNSSMKGRLRFETKEAAISFAQKKKWDYVVDKENEKKFVPRNYLENFSSDRRSQDR